MLVGLFSFLFLYLSGCLSWRSKIGLHGGLGCILGGSVICSGIGMYERDLELGVIYIYLGGDGSS